MKKRRHSREIRERAFQMYVSGKTFREIGKALGVRPSTVNNWAWRENWENRREEILREARRKVNEQLADAYGRVLVSLNELWENLYEQLQKQGPPEDFRTSMNAFLRLSELLLKYQAEGRDVREVVEKIFAVLIRHEKVGPVLMKYRDDILHEIERELK